MDFELYKTTRDFSTEYGTFIGLTWSATFIAFSEGMVTGNAMMMMAGMFLLGVGIGMPVYCAWRYKQHLQRPGDRVSWGMAWVFAYFTLIYASLLTGVAQFVYFNFFDKGRLMDYVQTIFASREMAEQYRMIGATDMLEQIKAEMTAVAGLTPVELALNLFANNILYSIILSVPVAIVAHRKCTDIKAKLDQMLAKKQ